ncbi:hypothetical protein C8F01DRAFT_1115616 [Mycena amicta]|nr:hypothetical protein C8F01DRAFT_1115616 [Mycena amicta]
MATPPHIFRDDREWGLRLEYIPTPSAAPKPFIHDRTYPLAAVPHLYPHPAVLPPANHTYPVGQTWTLRVDSRYSGGQYYSIDYTPLDLQGEQEEIARLSRIATPPGTYPTKYSESDNAWVIEPIAGMTEIYKGVPCAVHIDGDSTKLLTVAAAFDEASLQRFPEYPQLKLYVDELFDTVFGDDDSPGLCALPGIKTNMRSPELNTDQPHDGSSSHASTLLEGNGSGYAVPAVQANSPEAVEQRQRALTLFAKIYMLLAPLALSADEFASSTFRAFDMNIFSFGGLYPTGLTGLQMNVSSAWDGGDLQSFIGAVQGAWHVDIHDAAARWTLCILLMKLPPGSDPGAFLLGRLGLYVRTEVDANGWVRLFLFFKGNDLHCGSAPKIHPRHRQELLAWAGKKFSEQVNRVMLVGYSSEAHAERLATMAVSPAHSLETINPRVFHFYSTEGSPALGSDHDVQSRIGWELFMTTWNRSLAVSGTEIRINSAVPAFHRPETDSETWNPIDHAERFADLRSRWKYHTHLTGLYAIHMNKAQIAAGRRKALQLSDNFVEQDGIPLAWLFEALATDAPRDKRERVLTKGAPWDLRSNAAGKGDGANAAVDGQGGGEGSGGGRRGRSGAGRGHGRATPAARGRNKKRKASDEQLDLPSKKKPKTTDTPLEESSANSDELEEGGEDAPEDNPQEEEEDDERFEEDVYSVAMFVDRRLKAHTGEYEYRVRWSGCDASLDTWEPAQSMISCKDAMKAFEVRTTSPATAESLQQQTNSRSAPTHLQQLFDGSRDAAHLAKLQDLSKQLSSKKVTPATPRITEITTTADRLEATHKVIQSSSNTYNHIGGILMALQKAAGLLQISHQIELEATAKQLVLNHACGRAYLFYYEWAQVYGKQLTCHLVTAFRANRLAEDFPSYRDLVQHILTECEAATQGAINQHLPNSINSHNHILCASSLLHSLRPNCSQDIEFEIDCPSRTTLLRTGPGLEYVDGWMATTLYRFLSEHVILPIVSPLAPSLDTHQLIVRGAVAAAYVIAADDDSGLCYSELHDAFKHAVSLFPDKNGHAQTAKRTANNLAEDSGLIDWLIGWFEHQPRLPAVQEEAKQLAAAAGKVVEHVFNVRSYGRWDIRRRARQSQSVTRPIGGGIGHPVNPDLPLANLCPQSDQPCLGFLALMLRETLAFQRGKPAHIDCLRRILSCHHLTTSQLTPDNPDHFNPVRASNHFQTIMVKSLQSCGNPLTSKYALSNILVRFSVGLGYRNQTFATGYLNNKWFTSVVECCKPFELAFRYDRTMLLADTRCWGAPCDVFEVRPSNGLALAKRFGPFFEPKVTEAWIQYCHNMETRLPTYNDALALIDGLQLLGFGKKTITRMQIANFLALVELCQPPTLDDMATMIWEIKRGGLQGLRWLGFNIHGKNERAQITEALKILDGFLTQHLSEADKVTLHYGFIFIEHLLCKVARWHRVLFCHGLVGIVEQILTDIRDGHETAVLPIPLSETREILSGFLADKELVTL